MSAKIPMPKLLCFTGRSFGERGDLIERCRIARPAKAAVVARLLLAMLLIGAAKPVGARQIAFSFDDPVDPSNPVEAGANDTILRTLRRHRIQSQLYVAGLRVDSPSGLDAVRRWSDASHGIGNHSYSHWNFSSDQVTVNSFIRDVEKNEAMLKHIPGWNWRFRFPYLKEGGSREKRDELREYLASRGYRSGAVTIDTSDWYYNQRLRQNAASRDASALRRDYLRHLLDRANYYDQLAIKHLGRSPAHVMLLHVNEINAEYFDDTIRMFSKNGWTIISAETAYADPLYETSVDSLPAGESLIWAIANARGDATLRYPGEDALYESSAEDEKK